jgi:hypothetical protein
MSETLAELRADYDDLNARWRNGEPWLQARTGDAYRAWFRQSVQEGRPPDAPRKHSPVEPERFFARVVPGPDGHSYWIGGNVFRRNDGKTRNPRSWWWEHVHGRITDRGIVKPTCGEPHCITVDHQRLVPWSEVKREFTDLQCIGALQVAAMRLGYSPTTGEYDALRLRPTSTGLINRYSSWGRALAAAGLPEPSRNTRFKEVWTTQACVDALRKVEQQRGVVPSGRWWERTRQSPSYWTLMRRFGTWKNALRAAGLGK